MLLLVVYYIIQPILRTFGTWGWMSWRSDCRATSDPWWSTTCFNETMNQIRRRVLNETMNQIRRQVCLTSERRRAYLTSDPSSSTTCFIPPPRA